jgi:hypothetical protein
MFHLENPVESDRFTGNTFEAVPFWEWKKELPVGHLSVFSYLAG